tara:strand:+ start:229 stop:1128 length:900 start_codon:yes stop_codon:yes gene_type:complete
MKKTTYMPFVNNISLLSLMSILSFSSFAQQVTSNDEMQKMDHSQMDMSGDNEKDSRLLTTRSAHQYSDGYTLKDAPFSIAGPKQLKLADEMLFWGGAVDRFEYSNNEGDYEWVYDSQFWVGSDYEKLLVNFEGEVSDSGKLDESSSELLWSSAFTSFWNTELGLRYDTSEYDSQTWLAAGVSGLAPYWFEIDAMFYLTKGGQSELQISAEYDLLLTQRLILQPSFELSAFAKDDLEQGQGKGVSDVELGARLRYEISRQFAPYIGVEWVKLFGTSADISRVEGDDSHQINWVAGLKFWF